MVCEWCTVAMQLTAVHCIPQPRERHDVCCEMGCFEVRETYGEVDEVANLVSWISGPYEGVPTPAVTR